MADSIPVNEEYKQLEIQKNLKMARDCLQDVERLNAGMTSTMIIDAKVHQALQLINGAISEVKPQ